MAKKKKSTGKAAPPAPIAESVDDEDLMNDLLDQLDAKDHSVRVESAHILNQMDLDKQAEAIEKTKRTDSKDRFLARQARKAVALAKSYAPDDKEAEERLEREAKEEEKAINKICDSLHVQIHEINPDGHCLYSAVADQLALLNVIPPFQAKYTQIRRAAADYIATHPDDFLPFLPSTMNADGLMTQQEYLRYCDAIRDTAVWGGEPEIQALSRAYNVPIHVIQGSQPPIVVHEPSASSKKAAHGIVRISYHRRMYGLGEHYNSLRPKTGLLSTIQAIVA